MKKTWTGWGPTADQPQQHYLVEPRHLGGGGDLRFVAEYLRASGWKDISRTGGPMVFDSPDRSVRVGFDPTAMPGGWTVSGQAVGQHPAWHATFTTAVPIEIVAGFTDTLTKPRSAHAPNVWAPLEENGWETERGQHFTAVSPDRNAWLQYHQNEPGQAHWWWRPHRARPRLGRRLHAHNADAPHPRILGRARRPNPGHAPPRQRPGQ